MEGYLIIPLIAFLLSFFISHLMWNKKFEGQKLGRAYVGKYFWGFRYFLFPTISLSLLLQYDLRVFCLSLLFWAVVNTLLRMFFPEDRKPNKLQNLGHLWYLFLASTLYLNDPFWIQIWPSLHWLTIFLIAVTAGVLGKSSQLTNCIFDIKDISETQTTILNWMAPTLSLTLLCLNEIFRTQFSFETWAFYNAFDKPLFILVVGLGTVIFVPILARKKII